LKKRSKPRRPGQTPWRQDQHILRRLDVIIHLQSQGLYTHEVQRGVNEWLAGQGLQPLGERTFFDDLAHVKELYRERVADGAARNVASLNAVEKRAWRMLEAEEPPRIPDGKGKLVQERDPRARAVQAQLGGLIVKTVDARARIDGSIRQPGVDVSVNVEAPTPQPLSMSEADLVEAVKHTLEFVPSFREKVLGPNQRLMDATVIDNVEEAPSLLDAVPETNGHKPLIEDLDPQAFVR